MRQYPRSYHCQIRPSGGHLGFRGNLLLLKPGPRAAETPLRSEPLPCIVTSSLELAQVPKSVSLKILLDVSNAFSGFISPCTKSHSCICANPWRMTSIMPCARCSSSDVGHGGSEVTIATVLHLNGVRSYINDDCPTRHTPYDHIGSASTPGFLRGVCCTYFLQTDCLIVIRFGVAPAFVF
jgi:hypothetical protein